MGSVAEGDPIQCLHWQLGASRWSRKYHCKVDVGCARTSVNLSFASSEHSSLSDAEIILVDCYGRCLVRRVSSQC